jgi:hypothetical protein
MNYFVNQKHLRELLFERYRVPTGKSKTKVPVYRPGCYILSRTEETQQQKLGEASGDGGLYSRITNQYKLCFHRKDELWVRYLVITPRHKEGSKTFAQILEKLLNSAIDTKDVDSYSKEWLVNDSRKDLERKIINILQRNRQYWTHFLKFDMAGWHSVINDGSPINLVPMYNKDTKALQYESAAQPAMKRLPIPTHRYFSLKRKAAEVLTMIKKKIKN